MEITACPKCGSRKIFQGRLKEGVLSGYTSKNVCRDCGYQGSPLIFDNLDDYKNFLKGLKAEKEGGKEEQIEEDIKLSKKEKEVINFLNETEETSTKKEDEYSEKKSIIRKNTCTSLGVSLFVAGLLIFLGMGSNFFNIPLMLFLDGIVLFVAGFFMPGENRFEDVYFKSKLGYYPKIAGILLILNAIVNGFIYFSMMFFIAIYKMYPEESVTKPLGNVISILENNEITFLIVISVWLILCLVMFIGAIFSVIKKRWGIALIGALMGTFLIPILFYIPNIVSIVSLVLIAYSRNIFKK